MANINKNSNNFFMGVNSTKETPSNSLINHLKKLETSTNKQIKINNLTNLSKVSLEVVVDELIDNLEHDVYTLNNKIENFNKQQKKTVDLDTKEINKLKEIIRTLYILVITIGKTVKLNQNKRSDLLQQLRQTIQSSPGLLGNIDDIMKGQQDMRNDQLEHINILSNIGDVSKGITNNSYLKVQELNSFYNKLKSEVEINNGEKELERNNNQRKINQFQTNNNQQKIKENEVQYQQNNNQRKIKENEVQYQPNNNQHQEERQLTNQHDTKIYKKISNKINNTKISEKNAKKELNNFFL